MQLTVDEDLCRQLTARQMQALVRINLAMNQADTNEWFVANELALKQVGVHWSIWTAMREALLDSGLYSFSADGTRLIRHPDRETTCQQPSLDLSPPDSSPSDGYSPAAWAETFDTHIWPNVWKKTEKKDARRIYESMAPATGKEARELLQAILDGMRRYRQYIADNPWYTPQALYRWLRGRRWEDDYGSSQQADVLSQALGPALQPEGASAPVRTETGGAGIAPPVVRDGDLDGVMEEPDEVDLIWAQMALLFGAIWPRQYGNSRGRIADGWRASLREDGIDASEVVRALDRIRIERGSADPKKAPFPPNYAEFAAIARETRIPEDFPDPEKVLEEGVRAARNWSGHRWSSEHAQRIALEVTPRAFREYSSDRLRRIVYRETEKLRGRLARKEPLPPLHPRIEPRSSQSAPRQKLSKEELRTRIAALHGAMRGRAAAG